MMLPLLALEDLYISHFRSHVLFTSFRCKHIILFYLMAKQDTCLKIARTTIITCSRDDRLCVCIE